MATEKIIKIFKSELPKDLKQLESDIDKTDYTSIYELAHKYKLRLYYLNYETCLILCEQIVNAFKSQQFKQQLESAEELLKLLKTINHKLEL
ncbi:MAG: hypothetical protein R2730_11975 [Chitinophagales bacterium]